MPLSPKALLSNKWKNKTKKTAVLTMTQEDLSIECLRLEIPASGLFILKPKSTWSKTRF